MPMQSQQIPIARPAGWWKRHWKWAVPVLAALALTLFAGFILLVVSAVFGMIKSSDAYQGAMRQLRSSPAAATALGAPIREGWFPMGNIKINGPSGEANLQIPVSGPKGKGDLFVEATKSAGAWHFHVLVLQAGHQRFDVLEEASDSER
ncbi:MAG: cytochrome c oxidase assembly factor Coa1 family protein [Pseudoxanthomonas sp.]